MLVYIYIIFIIIFGLLASLVMPEFLNDMSIGFYFTVLGVLSLSALIIMLRKRTSFFKILSDYIVIVLTLSILAEGALIYFSANDVPKTTEQAVIVAGGGLFVESRLTAELERKLDKALKIYAENPELPIILSGGTDKNRTLPQCVAMKSYIEKQIKQSDLPMPKIIMEDTSSGIYENIKTHLKNLVFPLPI
ncbi:MAG: ElyC/SanA/YdcF family protein [Monoglobales bacterium]